MIHNLERDMEMGRGVAANGTAVGIARYFGPFNDTQRHKRDDIASKTNGYCASLTGGGDRIPAGESPGAAIKDGR